MSKAAAQRKDNGEMIVSVGLDVHQNTVQVCVLDPDGRVLSNRRVRNRIPKIIDEIARHGCQARVAIECSTGTAVLAEALIQQTGWQVWLCHPGYVRRMRQNPDKTDLRDAHLLADLVRVGYLPQVWLAPPEIRDLRALVRCRQQIVDRLRAIKLRIRALLREHRIGPPPCRLWTKAGRRWLADVRQRLPEHAAWVLGQHLDELDYQQKRLADAEARLRQVAEQDPVIADLLKQPGIGLVTACVLRAEVGRFSRFGNARQLARFCGLSPCNASSGQRQADAGLVRGCNRLLRATLIEAAHRLTRHDPYWSRFKQRMRERGKPGSLIAAAVANRWVRRLFHAMRALEQQAA